MTWGGLRTITWDAFVSTRYLDEAYAMLSPDWYSSNKLAPCGINADDLKSDLEKIGNGTIPDINPQPTPTPTPTPTPVPAPIGLTLQETLDTINKALTEAWPTESPFNPI